MQTKFSEVIAGVQFDFLSMNVKRCELFQVYVDYEGKQRRFHLQSDTGNVFRITDEQHCPPPYRDLVEEFNAAIHHHCEE
jgi:hypothetical protein